MNEIDLPTGGPIPTLSPPSDTLAAIKVLPQETMISTCLKRLAVVSRDYSIWAIQDAARIKRSKRPAYHKQVRRIVRDCQMNRYLDRISCNDINVLSDRPFIYFPLPYEPEYPNTSLARSFNDTLALVKQTALSAPAGYNLVVKEHVVGVGHRRKSFYTDMLCLPNVKLARNTLRSLDLIRRCSAVVTLNGTAGLEAGYFGKKAVLFAPNVEYSQMLHVRVVERFGDLPKILREAVLPPTPDQLASIQNDARRHFLTVNAVCVDVSGIDVFGGTEPFLADHQYEKLFELFEYTYDHIARKPN